MRNLSLISRALDQDGDSFAARLTLGERFVAWLLGWQERVNTLNAIPDARFYCIELFSSAVDYGSTFVEDYELEDGQWYLAKNNRLCGEEVRVDAATVRLTHDGVLWTAHVKHSSSGYLETPEIPWAHLAALLRGAQPFARAQKCG